MRERDRLDMPVDTKVTRRPWSLWSIDGRFYHHGFLRTIRDIRPAVFKTPFNQRQEGLRGQVGHVRTLVLSGPLHITAASPFSMVKLDAGARTSRHLPPVPPAPFRFGASCQISLLDYYWAVPMYLALVTSNQEHRQSTVRDACLVSVCTTLGVLRFPGRY